jgi:hypothetical protein
MSTTSIARYAGSRIRQGAGSLEPRQELTGTPLGSIVRLLLRFILVPLGYLAEVLAGFCVILFGWWQAGMVMLSDNPDAAANLFGALVASPVLFLVLLGAMWQPASIGILISEAFAIRSWIFHAINGAISAWVTWEMFDSVDKSILPTNEPRYVIAAGLAGGFAYWAVAGWSAGFWKPVFARPVSPASGDSFNPPAPTKV